MRIRMEPAGPVLRALVIALGLVAIVPAAAAAHASLESTAPANDQVVPSAPDAVTMQFSEPITVAFGGVKVFDPSGDPLDGVDTDADSKTLTIDLPSGMEDGSYAVSWRAISADGHPVHGAFVFHVGERSGSAAEDRAKDASSSSRALAIAYGVARGFALAALLGAAGGAVFAVFIAPGWRPRWLLAMLGVLLVATLCSYVLDAAIASGLSIGDTLRPGVLGEVGGTNSGRALLIRFELVLVARAVASRLTHSRWRYVAVAPFIAACLAQSLGGHAVAADPAWARVGADMLHVLGAAIWLGGLVQLLPGLRERAPSIANVRRYSDVAFGCVLVLVATGLFAAWQEIGFSMEAITSTTYGRLVAGKSALFLELMAFGAINRIRNVPAMDVDLAAGSARLRRFVVGELVLMALVIALTAWLIASPPAKTQVQPDFIEKTLDLGGGGSVQLIIDPATTGQNLVHVYVFDEHEQPDREVSELEFEASNKPAGVDHLPIKLEESGPGHYTTSSATIPFAGRWKFTAWVRHGKFDEDQVTFSSRITEPR
jgi:copper transport protein